MPGKAEIGEFSVGTLSDVIFHSVRRALTACRTRRRSVLVLFEQPGLFDSEVARELLSLFRRRLAVAVNDLAQNAFVNAQLASQEVLPNSTSKELKFQVWIHR